MKTPERAAELLVRGTLERKAWRQLEQEQFAAKVQERLAQVGLARLRWRTLGRAPD